MNEQKKKKYRLMLVFAIVALLYALSFNNSDENTQRNSQSGSDSQSEQSKSSGEDATIDDSESDDGRLTMLIPLGAFAVGFMALNTINRTMRK